ncbi:MAG: hypothetical protein EBE86_034160 [Hormoscilla sp. GUM202]|nr:hypothetical protein [Hormoscilla sp. GUM202]
MRILTEAGTYRLVVDGDFSDIGDYNFRLLDVASAATLTLETEITGSLDPGKESDLYSFEGDGRTTRMLVAPTVVGSK